MKVKQLVWEHREHDKFWYAHTYTADRSQGFKITIKQHIEGFFSVHQDDLVVWSWHRTSLEDAQQYAQEYFNSLILSGLEEI